MVGRVVRVMRLSQQINSLQVTIKPSIVLAPIFLVSDMALGLLAGDLKRKEMLSGRLADIHAHLFIATAILKFYEAGQKLKLNNCMQN